MDLFKLVCLSASLTYALSAFAHHGFGTFDLQTEIELSGEVTDLDWVNPHAWLYLNVTRQNGEVASYRCEMRAATVLRRSGWSPDMFPIGSKVTIRGAPDRKDPESCYVSTVVFPDGSTIDRYGQRTAPTPVENLSERAQRLADGTPNISGDWAPEQYVMSDPRGREGRLVPLSSVSAGASDGETGQGGQGPWATAPVEPTALGEQLAEIFDSRTADNPRMRCEITSIIFDWDFDGPINRITQHENRIVLEYGRHGFTRTVHMNMDEHPAEIEPSRAGHSIGRWEGDTLVVDTVGFSPGIIAPPVFHGGELHVVERFTVDAENWTLTREYTATDADYFHGTYEGSDTLAIADAPFEPAECKDLTDVDYGERSDGEAGRAESVADQGGAEPADTPWWKFWD